MHPLPLVLLPALALSQPVALDDFADIAAWQHNQDGGVVSEAAGDRERFRSAPQGLRIAYTDAPPHWSNLARPLSLPGTHGALELWVYRRSAELAAALHLWLLEPDGDGWVARVTSDGVTLGGWATGWHHVQVPLSDFRYDPRGDKRPDLASVDRLLFGCNFGSLDVTLDDLRFLPSAEAPMAPGTQVLDDGLVEITEVSLDDADPLNTDLLGEGWWDLEPGSTWTGRDSLPAEVVFTPLRDRDYVITYANVIARPDIIPDYAVRCLYNGEEIGVERPTQRDTSFRFLLPVERVKRGEARIALEAPLYVPRDAGEGADTRTLGVKVGGIRIAAYQRPTARLKRSDKGTIAVLRDDLPVVGAASDPTYLGRTLARAGYAVNYVPAADLLSPVFLSKRNFDLLLLPYGASYPAHGKDALVGYLGQGGSFLSMGGYAFDNPLIYRDGRWIDRASAGLPGVRALEVASAGAESALFGEWLAPEPGGPAWFNQPAARVRWTGGRAGVRLAAPAAQRIVLRVSMAYCDPAWHLANATKPLRISGTVLVNGVSVGRFEGESGHQVLEFDATEPLKRRTEARVAILSSLWRKSDVSASRDGTRRGVAVRWVALVPEDAAPLETPPGEFDVRTNTHFGRTGDSLGLEPTQIGVFDPSFPLRNASLLRIASALLTPNERAGQAPPWERRGEHTGWAASCLSASNNPVFPDLYGVRIPVLEAYDAYGRPRGAAGAIVHNYAGPFAGSTWAFLGVDNADLFAPGQARMLQLLRDVVDRCLRPVYVERLTTDLACYRGGETARIEAVVRNGGPLPRAVEARVSVEGGAETAKGESTALRIEPGAAETVTFDLAVADLPSRLVHTVACTLVEDGGRMLHRAETGFVVWEAEKVAQGPAVSWRDNYLRVADRPLFLCGTNQTGMMFHSADEDPLTWGRDFQQMQDHGVNVLRILHFSPFAKDGDPRRATSPLELAKDMPKRLARQLDAIVQLAQGHDVILFLTLHDWMNVDLTDEELAAQRSFARQIALRYRNVPGLLLDVQNEPHVQPGDTPSNQRLWNDFLAARYGTVERLREAWGDEAPTADFGDIRVATGEREWPSVKSADYSEFKTLLLNRWVRENAAGVKAGDPHLPVTVGYLPSMWQADKVRGQEHTDFANMHFYGHGDSFPAEFLITDRRFAGKGLSIGEFGAKVHPAWGSTADPDGFVGVTMWQAERWLLRLSHYTFGLGGAMLCNWDWKDMTGCVFPWGIVHPWDPVPKDQLLAFRNFSLMVRQLEPRYEPPALYVLIPDTHRLGASEVPVTKAVMALIDRLLSLHVPFGMANESDLRWLPAEAEALIWPVPFCPTDEAYEAVRDFVRGGGRLLVTGDVSYDPLRQRTRTRRLEELLGLRFVRERCPDIRWDAAEPLQAGRQEWTGHLPARPCIEAEPAGASVLLSSQEGVPLVTRHRPGQGEAWYVPDPLELHSDDAHLDLYRRFIEDAGVAQLPVLPDDPYLHVFRVHLNGAAAWVLFNNSPGRSLTVNIQTRAGPLSLDVAGKSPALAVVGNDGRLLGAETHGAVWLSGKQVLDADGHVWVTSLDGRSIEASEALLLCGFEDATLRADWLNGKQIEVGELVSGRWRSHELLEAPVQINGLRRLSLLLAARKGQAREARAKVEALGRLSS